MRAFSIGASTVLIRVWPVLKSLPQIGTPWSIASCNQRRDVDRQVRGAVGEGDAFHQRGVGVEHRGGDRCVVVAQRRLEAFEVAVVWSLLHEDLGRGAPDHDQAVAVVCGLEVANVLANLLGHFHLRAALDVRAVEALDVVLVEDGRHRLDGLEEVGDRLDVLVAVEDAALDRCFVGVVGEGVPGAEDDVVEVCERDEVADQRRAVFGALAEADGAHLGERADGPAAAAPGVLDAGDERRGDGAEADEQDAEAALCRLDRVGREFDEVFCFQDHTSLAGERHEWHLPLRGHAPCLRPVFDRALPLAEQRGERALAAEAPDDPLSCVRSIFHGGHPNEFFVILQA